MSRFLRVDTADRKIGLSLKRAKWGEGEGPQGDVQAKEDSGRDDSDAPTRGGMDDHGALGTDKIEL